MITANKFKDCHFSNIVVRKGSTISGEKTILTCVTFNSA